MWVSAPLYYLDKKYKREKVAGKSVYVEGGHRADAVPHQVTIYNGRLKETSVGEHERLNKHGFVLHSIKDSIFERIKRIDMPKIETNESLRLQYYALIEQAVLEATSCDYVRAFNFTLRNSEIVGVHTKPIGDNSARGPVNDVHTDFTPTAPAIISIAQLSETLGLGGCRFSLLNCWRNIDLENPISHWPMAICDIETVDHEHDLIARISPENGNHIYNLLPNKNHKWYTFPAQTANELLLFKQYDTRNRLRCYTPHTSFDDPRCPPHAPPRYSCEVRCICWFDPTGKYAEAMEALHKKGVGQTSRRVKERSNRGGMHYSTRGKL